MSDFYNKCQLCRKPREYLAALVGSMDEVSLLLASVPDETVTHHQFAASKIDPTALRIECDACKSTGLTLTQEGEMLLFLLRERIRYAPEEEVPL